MFNSLNAMDWTAFLPTGRKIYLFVYWFLCLGYCQQEMPCQSHARLLVLAIIFVVVLHVLMSAAASVNEVAAQPRDLGRGKDCVPLVCCSLVFTFFVWCYLSMVATWIYFLCFFILGGSKWIQVYTILQRNLPKYQRRNWMSLVQKVCSLKNQSWF